MGNRTSLDLLFFCLFLTATTSWGATTWDKFDCSTQRVSYLGHDVLGGGKKICVTRKGDLIEDGEAKSFCAKSGFSRFLNLANPDYAKADSAADDTAVADNGKQGKMYLCFNGGVRKYEICRQVAQEPKNKSLKMQWQADGPNGHGYCKCDKGKGPENCDSADAPVAAESPKSGNCDSSENLTDYVPVAGQPARPTWCQCKEGFRPEGGQKSPSEDLNHCVPDAKQAVADEEISPELKTCLDNWVDKSQQCKDKAEAATSRCNSEEAKDLAAAKNSANSEVRAAGTIADFYQQAAVAKNAGKQNGVSSCLRAGLGANAVKSTMSGMKEDCDQKVQECTDLCSEDKQSEFTAQCSALLNKVSADTENNSPEKIKKNIDYYNEQSKTILQTNLIAGNKMCTDKTSPTSAVSLKSNFDNFLTGIGKALQSAAMCACNVAASAVGTSGSSCSNIPTAAECAANPSLAGCSAYSALDACTMGSPNYNANVCACQNNPAGLTCKTATAAGTNGFAGADVKTASGAGTSFGPNGSGSGLNSGGAGDFSLGSNSAGDIAAIKPQSLTGAGAGGLGGGGGGGVGAPPGSGGGDPNAGGAEGDGRNSGGVFGQVKSFVSSMFGGSPKGGVGTAPGAPAVKYDLDKYRPKGLRGVAGGSEVGLKNTDIWRTIFNRYDDIRPTLPSKQ